MKEWLGRMLPVERPDSGDISADDSLRPLVLRNKKAEIKASEPVEMGTIGYKKGQTLVVPMSGVKIKGEQLVILRTIDEIHLMKVLPEELLTEFRPGHESCYLLSNGLIISSCHNGPFQNAKNGMDPVSLGDIKKTILKNLDKITDAKNWGPGIFNHKLVATICMAIKTGELRAEKDRPAELLQLQGKVSAMIPFKKK